MKIYCLLVCCLIAGCITTKGIYSNYAKLGAIKNGVDKQAAKTIAQKELINTDEKDDFRISLPTIKTGPIADKYPQYWFVVFGHNWFEPLSTVALTPSYTDLSEKFFLVVINKTTGKIPFFGEWYPKRENDFDWVFSPYAYNRKDPLTLPPGRQSKELF